MTVDQIEITLHDVFDHMVLNHYLRELARKVSKKYVMRKGYSVVVADRIVAHVLH